LGECEEGMRKPGGRFGAPALGVGRTWGFRRYAVAPAVAMTSRHMRPEQARAGKSRLNCAAVMGEA
jgi:hypothetical protein